MPDLPPPSLRLRLDDDALAANWRALDARSGSARAGAAVKADAYGIGADKAVPVLRNAGARDFFVAHWSEAPEVLRYVDPAQVSVLHGPIRSEDAAYARAAGVKPVINSVEQAQRWIEAGGTPRRLIPVSIIRSQGPPPASIQRCACSTLLITGLTPAARA